MLCDVVDFRLYRALRRGRRSFRCRAEKAHQQCGEKRGADGGAQRTPRVLFAADFPDEIDDVRQFALWNAPDGARAAAGRFFREEQRQRREPGHGQRDRRARAMVEKVEDDGLVGQVGVAVLFAGMDHKEVARVQPVRSLRVDVAETARGDDHEFGKFVAVHGDEGVAGRVMHFADDARKGAAFEVVVIP